MQKNKHKKTAFSMRSSVVFIFIMLALLFSLYSYSLALYSSLSQDSNRTLGDLAVTTASQLNIKVNDSIRTIGSISLFNQEDVGTNLENIKNSLMDFAEINLFKRIIILDTQGNIIIGENDNNTYFNTNFFNKALEGIASISNPIIDQIDGEKINLYTTPILNNDNVVAITIGVVSSKYLEETIHINAFDGKASTHIIDSNGNIILTSDTNTDILYKNILDVSLNDDDDALILRSNLKSGKIGSISYKWNDSSQIAFYIPTGINDWFAFMVVPANVINTIKNDIIFFTSLICVFAATLLITMTYLASKQKKQHLLLLSQIDLTDPITGFNNWKRFSLVSTELITNNIKTSYALISFDIDKFKIINDLYGHEQGNIVLTNISKILNNILKSNEAFARVTADNFVVLLEYNNNKDIDRFVEKITPIRKLIIGDDLKFSIGVYMVNDFHTKIDIMYDRSVIAKKSNKYNVSTLYTIFDDSMRKEGVFEKEMENQMRLALINNEFKLYLQPKYHCINGRNTLYGAEALVRWAHPTKGILSPAVFIPLFEKNGFIEFLDIFIFEEVCKLQQKWKNLGSKIIPISVNVSRVTFSTQTFINNYVKVYAKYDISEKMIELEITESAIRDSEDSFFEIVDSLHNFNFTVSMDDFGSGYSSLNMLRDFNFDVIKLDRAFLGIDNDIDVKGKSVIGGVVNMLQKLNFNIIAEGVETKQQLDFLISVGCNYIQGYYFSKPMPVEQFEEFINTNYII